MILRGIEQLDWCESYFMCECASHKMSSGAFWSCWIVHLKSLEGPGASNSNLTHSYDYQDSGMRFVPHLPKCWTTP